MLSGSSFLLRKYLEFNHMPSDSHLDDRSPFCEMKALRQMKAVSVNTELFTVWETDMNRIFCHLESEIDSDRRDHFI